MASDSNAAFDSISVLRIFHGRLVSKESGVDKFAGCMIEPFLVFRIHCEEDRYFKFRAIGEDALVLASLLKINHGYEIKNVKCVGLSYSVSASQVQVSRKLSAIPNMTFCLKSLKRACSWMEPDEFFGDVIGLVEDQSEDEKTDAVLRLMAPVLGSKKVPVHIMKQDLQDLDTPVIVVITHLMTNSEEATLKCTRESQLIVNPFWLMEFHELYHWRWGSVPNKLKIEPASFADVSRLRSIWLSLEAIMHFVVITSVTAFHRYCSICDKSIGVDMRECCQGPNGMHNAYFAAEAEIFDGHNSLNSVLTDMTIRKLVPSGEAHQKIQKLLFVPLNVRLNCTMNQRMEEVITVQDADIVLTDL